MSFAANAHLLKFKLDWDGGASMLRRISEALFFLVILAATQPALAASTKSAVPTYPPIDTAAYVMGLVVVASIAIFFWIFSLFV